MARQFSSLQVYNYRLYFYGQMVSLVGTWMQTTAQAWLVVRADGLGRGPGRGDGAAVPADHLFTLFGGVVADRVPKRKLLVVRRRWRSCRRRSWACWW